ncbi:MAG: hypothetical protein IKE33_05725 [Erysipelotrichaceae bacterium]|nr:hypothetical protein [Erysipelotrichaceae bacterium]
MSEKKSLTTKIATIIGSAGLAISSLFGSQDDAFDNNLYDPQADLASMEVVDADPIEVDEDKRKQVVNKKQRSKINLKTRIVFFAILLSLIWIAVYLGLGAIDTYLATYFSPLASNLLKFGLKAVLLGAMVLAGIKKIFPKADLKKVLRPKNISVFLIVMAILFLIDAGLNVTLKDYSYIKKIVNLALELTFMSLILYRICFKRRYHYLKQE